MTICLNYMMLGAYDFEILNEIGIAQSVMEKLENSKFFNKNGEFLEISEINSLEEIKLLVDLHIGTILNSYSEEDVLSSIYEIQLPDEYIPFSLQFARYNVFLHWKNNLLNAIMTKHNQIVVSPSSEIPIGTNDIVITISEE
ncbi:MAG: hypothetical protein KH301_07665 [Brachyspira sp.]|nr:hypothetical protein [Brachyspira sp.]